MTDVLDTPPAPTEGEAGPAGGRQRPRRRAPVAVRLRGGRRGGRRGPPSSSAPGGGRASRTGRSCSWRCPIAVVGGCVVYVLANIHANLILKVNTPTGGDFGAHVWGPAYLRDHILPHWRLSGWAPDWYGGFPMYKFYMVVPALVTVLLDVVLPYGVALKMVSALGPGRPAGVLLGLRQAGRACPSRSRRCSRSPSTFFLFDWSLHDLRRQRRLDDGGRVLLQHRPVHVDAVPRRARPRACGRGRGAPSRPASSR